MDWKAYIYEHPQVGPLYQRTTRHPSWVIKGALAAAALVVLVPLVLVSVAALIVGIAVFAVLGLAARIVSLFDGTAPGSQPPGSQSPGNPDSPHQQPGFSADDGRRNVRVIRR